jgi:hypothetical protein
MTEERGEKKTTLPRFSLRTSVSSARVMFSEFESTFEV